MRGWREGLRHNRQRGIRAGRRHERRRLVVAGLVPRRAALARAAAARHDLVAQPRQALRGAHLAEDLCGTAEAAKFEVEDGRGGARGVFDGERARAERRHDGRVVGRHEQRGGPLAARRRAERDVAVVVGLLFVLHVEGDGGRASRAERAAALEDGGVAARGPRAGGRRGEPHLQRALLV